MSSFLDRNKTVAIYCGVICVLLKSVACVVALVPQRGLSVNASAAGVYCIRCGKARSDEMILLA